MHGRGEVLEFDADRGWGTVGDGEHEYFFHCTRIADGSRMIAPGTAVTYTVTAGHLGRWEATLVTPVSPTAP